MIIYNVTINIHESVHDQWMKWMQEKHINDVLATGKFSSARMVKVLIKNAPTSRLKLYHQIFIY